MAAMQQAAPGSHWASPLHPPSPLGLLVQICSELTEAKGKLEGDLLGLAQQLVAAEHRVTDLSARLADSEELMRQAEGRARAAEAAVSAEVRASEVRTELASHYIGKRGNLWHGKQPVKRNDLPSLRTSRPLLRRRWSGAAARCCPAARCGRRLCERR